MSFNLKKILKSLLFSTSQPLSIKDIQAVVARFHDEASAAEKAAAGQQQVPDVLPDEEQTVIEDIIAQVPTLLTATQIREAMDAIAAELDEAGEVFRLVQSSSGFKFVISKEYSNWVRLLRNDPRPQKLSRAAMETLAIIAYRQPVTRAEIEAIRGVGADSAITRLAEKDLIYVSGRADLPGRPIQYSTTQNFLDYAGVNSLDELPASDVLSPTQISEWIRRASAPAPRDGDVGLPSEDVSEDGGEAENLGGANMLSADDAAGKTSDSGQTPSVEPFDEQEKRGKGLGDSSAVGGESAENSDFSARGPNDSEHASQPWANGASAAESGAADSFGGASEELGD